MLQSDHHTNRIPTLEFFFQVGCPSCRPISSVKVQKACFLNTAIYSRIHAWSLRSVYSALDLPTIRCHTNSSEGRAVCTSWWTFRLRYYYYYYYYYYWMSWDGFNRLTSLTENKAVCATKRTASWRDDLWAVFGELSRRRRSATRCRELHAVSSSRRRGTVFGHLLTHAHTHTCAAAIR